MTQMKKQVTILVICLVVLAGLGGALFFALQHGDEEAEAASSNPQVTLLAAQPADIQSVTLRNAKGQLAITRSGDTMQVEGLDGITLAQAPIDTLLGQCAAITAKQEISAETGNLADFGLDPAAAEAKIVLADKTVVLKVGGDAPAGLGKYAEVDGKLYLMEPDSLSAFETGAADLVSTVVVPTLTQDIQIESVTLTNPANRESPLSFTYQPAPLISAPSDTSGSGEAAEKPEATWLMTSPAEEVLPAANVDSWAKGAFGLAGQAVAAIRPDEGRLSGFGLIEPQAALELKTSDGKTTRLIASKTADGACYAMVEGGAVVYTVSESSIPWLTMTVELARKSIFPPTETAAVRQMQIQSGETYTVLNGHGAVSINGKTAAPEKVGELVRQVLMLPPKLPKAEIDPTLDPAVTITIAYADQSRGSDLLELVPTGSGDLYMILNGECSYITEERQATDLLEKCQAALAE